MTNVIELAVGAVCLAGAVAMWRSGVRLVGALIAVAGLSAVVHAIGSMAT